MDSFKGFVVAISLVSSVLAQSQSQAKGKAAPKAATQVICTDTDSKTACNTFKAMAEANDRDIVSVIDGTQVAYVCPRPKVDEFFVVSFTRPEEYKYIPIDPKNPKGAVTQTDVVSFIVYALGVEASNLYELGTWKRLVNDPAIDFTVFTSSQESTGLEVRIDAAEVYLKSEFKNANGTQTVNMQTIRRSTGRFRETWAIKDAKDSFQVMQGQCFMYGTM
jgi:hypothetical protein